MITSVNAFPRPALQTAWWSLSIDVLTRPVPNGLAKSVAKEMGSRNIRANCIAPGFIESDMTRALPEEVRKDWATKIPLRRGGTPEDVANVALFLASDLSSYVTGQVINCCGGMQC